MRFFLLAIVIVLSPQWSWAASKAADVKQGNLLYNQQKYPQALEKYNHALDKAPDSSIINFDAGTALYKKGEYDQAIPYFEKSLLSDEPQFQAKGHYNLGSALYNSGKMKESVQADTTVKLWEGSKSHLEKSLKLNPTDQDAQFNLEVVQRELERLKKKIEKQNKQGNKASQPSSGEAKNQLDQKEKGSSSQGQQESDKVSKKGEKNKQQQQGSQDNTEQPQSSLPVKSQENRPGELPREEAKMLLDNYSQNEEPKGLLNMRLKKQGAEVPVLKDW